MEAAQVFRAVDARDRSGRLHQSDDAHPVGEGEATRGGVRTATGPTDDREAIELELVGQSSDIGRPIEQAPPGQRIGQADARPVNGDQPCANAARQRVVRRADDPAGAEAVKEEHGPAMGIAVLGVAKAAAVGESNLSVVRPQARPRDWAVLSANRAQGCISPR